MARIRTVKPEFWQDEKIAPLPPLDRLVFLGLISQADDAGRLVDSPRLLNGILFPYTDDDCKSSLEILDDIGVIERGTTASGQSIVQIVNWHHQKIDKPNFSAALPKIEIRRKYPRRVPKKLREAIFERDEGICCDCGAETHLSKGHPRYGGEDDLCEIDHIIPLIDGGSNHPSNLQVLCKKCNRRKQGECAKERNSMELEEPTKDRGSVADVSATHINDQLSTINDQRSKEHGALGADYPPEFESAWKIYPSREGSNPKKPAFKAWKARIREDVSHSELFDAAVKYRQFCDAKATTGTVYVMQGSTFFGPNERWAQDFIVDKLGEANRELIRKRNSLEGVDLENDFQ